MQVIRRRRYTVWGLLAHANPFVVGRQIGRGRLDSDCHATPVHVVGAACTRESVCNWAPNRTWAFGSML